MGSYTQSSPDLVIPIYIPYVKIETFSDQIIFNDNFGYQTCSLQRSFPVHASFIFCMSYYKYSSSILPQADEDKDQDEEGALGRPSIWVGTHTIHYRACTGDTGEGSTSASSKNASTNFATPSKSTKKSQGKRNTDSLGGESSFTGN